MRLFYICDFFVPYVGGQERASAVLVQGLQARGYEVMVVTGHHNLPVPDTEQWHGIPIHRLAAEATLKQGDARGWFALLAELSRLKREFAPDVYEVNTFGPLAVAHLQTLRVAPAPFTTRFNTNFENPAEMLVPDSIVTKTATHAAWATSVSAATLKEACAYIAGLREHSSVLYSGHAEPAFVPAPPPQPARLLCMGRLVHKKGFDIALNAFARVHAAEPQARMRIAGDGPEKAALMAQAAALGLEGAVEFLGWVLPDHIYSLLNDTTLFVLPSRVEGLPNTAIEAALLARPTIGTAVSGVPEVVIDGKTGILVPSEDAARLAAAMLELIRSPERAAGMGAAARAHARRTFTIERYVDQYDALYRRVAAGEQPALPVASLEPRA